MWGFAVCVFLIRRCQPCQCQRYSGRAHFPIHQRCEKCKSANRKTLSIQIVIPFLILCAIRTFISDVYIQYTHIYVVHTLPFLNPLLKCIQPTLSAGKLKYKSMLTSCWSLFFFSFYFRVWSRTDFYDFLYISMSFMANWKGDFMVFGTG